MKLRFNYFIPISIWYHIENFQLFLESFLWQKLCEVFPQWHLFFDKRCQVQKGCHPLQSNIIPIGNIKEERFFCSSIISGILDMTKEHSDLNFKSHTINTQSILTWFLKIQTKTRQAVYDVRNAQTDFASHRLRQTLRGSKSRLSFVFILSTEIAHFQQQ